MTRINIQKIQPEAYQAMFNLEGYLATSTLCPALQEAIRLRASLLNGCHFCIKMHTEAALKLGVTEQQVKALAD